MILSLFLIVAFAMIVSSKYTVYHASEFAGEFNPIDIGNGKDIGGLPRILEILKQPRNRIFIYTGSFIRVPYSADKVRLQVELDILHRMRVDILVLGENEYKLPQNNFGWYISATESRIVSTNIPGIGLSEKVKDGLLVLSYTCKDILNNPTMSSYHVHDLIDSLNNKTKHFETLGKYVYIAAGCAGIKEALQIAKQTKLIHIVISGCLKSSKPKNEEPETIQYPMIVKNNFGGKVIIAHLTGTTKYIGKLEFTLNAFGGIKDYKGTKIYVNSSESMDNTINDLLNELNALELGKTAVYLNGKCERRECNLGNMITDAFIQYKSDMYKGEHWTDTPIALIPAGNIKSDLNTSATQGVIFLEQLHKIFPKPQKLVTVEILGSWLRAAFIATLDNEGQGKFLQVSGLHIRFDRRRKVERRMIAFMCRCAECQIPSLLDYRSKQKYRVITTADMLKGAFGHYVFGNSSEIVSNENITDLEAVRRYVKQMKFINIRSEERIRIVRKKSSGELFQVRKSFLFALTIITCSVFP